MEQKLGLNYSALVPTVLAGLEAAFLSAASQILSTTVATVLEGKQHSREEVQAVKVNGLIDCSGFPEEAAAEAVRLTQEQGYRCLRIKV